MERSCISRRSKERLFSAKYQEYNRNISMTSLSLCIMTFSTSLTICSTSTYDIWQRFRFLLVQNPTSTPFTRLYLLLKLKQKHRTSSSWISWRQPSLLSYRQTLFGSNPTTPTIPVSVRSKVWVWGNSFAGIVGSNSVGSMEVCLLWMLCVFR